LFTSDPTREAIMGALMIKCPTTGHEFSTGIQIEEDTLERLPETTARSLCPHCAEEHFWSTRESRLVESFGATPGIEAVAEG
jgi:hypothetical protein